MRSRFAPTLLSTPFGATIAWKGNGEPDTFAAPAAWSAHAFDRIRQADLEQNYELVRIDRDSASGGAVEAYRHRETGRMVYIGRPSIASRDAQERDHVPWYRRWCR